MSTIVSHQFQTDIWIFSSKKIDLKCSKIDINAKNNQKIESSLEITNISILFCFDPSSLFFNLKNHNNRIPEET
ncbi:hypothetical protein BpHYR1_037450 [Brachionus plicatilis]|uniref:Uncharacterized protein n=1 Tax=Brachionus plicatilis TaxID=10195 RepID=A0A3M7SFM4_BRAPC|nr:hypothetical protein BpHYR1_037450 [Brachionus plicatilis]